MTKSTACKYEAAYSSSSFGGGIMQPATTIFPIHLTIEQVMEEGVESGRGVVGDRLRNCTHKNRILTESN